MTFKQVLQRRGRKMLETKALRVLSPYQILLAPMMTEKSYGQTTTQNKFFFKIHKKANKNDVKKAVAAVYGVTPIKVNTVIVEKKGRANRKNVRAAFKKAIVTLQEGDTINLV